MPPERQFVDDGFSGASLIPAMDRLCDLVNVVRYRPDLCSLTRSTRAELCVSSPIARAKCGYAYYVKTLRQLGAGRQMRDFLYYRCSGSDGYRFGGEPICSKAQIQGNMEMTVWSEISKLLTDPGLCCV